MKRVAKQMENNVASIQDDEMFASVTMFFFPDSSYNNVTR
jgi:hypothetical protein